MILDFADNFLTFYIINEKLDELQEAINCAITNAPCDDNSRTYWKQPHIWTLSKLETRVQEAKRITASFLNKLKRGGVNHDFSY